MFKSYVKTAWRNLFKKKSYTVINILGLSAGIGVCLIIACIIHFETSFDNYHSKHDRIYRVLTEYHHSKDLDVFYGSAVPLPLPSILKNDFPELKKVTGVSGSSNDQILVLNVSGDVVKKFKESRGVVAVEPDFFDIFDFTWLAGDPKKSLEDPHSVVLTKEIAEKYFGDWQNALGQSLKLNSYLVKVTGILDKIPVNTDFQFKLVLPYRALGLSKNSDWQTSSDNHNCYLLLPPNVTVATFDRELRAVAKKYRGDANADELVLQPLNKVHYYDSHSHIANFSGRTVSLDLIRGLWIVAAFILIIACVNFINLSTAQAMNRAREIGVRKVLGSSAQQLKFQVFIETMFLVIISVVVAVIIVAFSLNAIGNLLNIPLSLSLAAKPWLLFLLIGIIFLVTLLAGFYPALVLSNYKPVDVLKSKMSGKNKAGFLLRKSLVVFQFVIGQALLMVMVIMVKQMNFFTNGSMGFDKDAIITVSIPTDSAGLSKIDYLRTALGSIRGVTAVSFNSNPPATDNNSWNDFSYDRSDKGKGLYSIIKYADSKYLDIYNLQLVAGNNFSSDTAHEYLVNEELLKILGVTHSEEALNRDMSQMGNYLPGKIVGVLKNFHSTGFKDKYSSVFLTPHKRDYNNVAIRLTSQNSSPATLKTIENLWNQTFSEFVFEFQFVDQTIQNFYQQETQQTQLYKIMAGIAVFLGCLGLFGLASFMATQRLKEVGIRKVLGASANSIIYLFAKEFVLLIGIAFLIASPIAWYFMNKWLQGYAFRIDLSFWIFIMCGLITLFIVVATVAANAIRAASANPIRILRTE